MNWKAGFILGFSALMVGLSGCQLSPQSTLADEPRESAMVKSPAQGAIENLTHVSPAADQAMAFRINQDEQGRALQGYDPVAYFTDGEAIPGDEIYSLSWQGTEWLFATAENRDRFAQTPEQYAPKNGGYCTFGVVLSKKLDGDPEVWSIINDHLYIFLNEEVRDKFLKDQSGNLTKVLTNWPQIRDKSPEELE
ncbi:MAG: YHS domain-containing (seleno)protein [Cyanobacteria bacterium P01_D01_bin.44]